MTTTGPAKRIQYHEYGGPEVMRLEEFDVPAPDKGEVLVRVRAAALNPMDAGIRRGALKAMTGKSFPRGLGHDLVGVVEAVGTGVTRFRVGDEVVGCAGMKTSGAYGELAILEEKACALKPAGLSFEEAATLPVPAGTALQALIGNSHLNAGQSVFVTGCLGAVGRSAIALAHGARVAGSARESAADDARAIGVETVVGFDFDPKDLAGRFDVILESSGKLDYSEGKVMLKKGGTFVDILPSPAKFARAALPGGYKVQVTKNDPDDLAEVLDLAAQGKLQIPIEQTVPLDEAIAALTEWETHPESGRGKLVITID
ncbi:NADPH:quinone reductase [Microlunatus endophyticus]|uniref:NADPH:quinone reductase n=1 Tax=Microlunatus endophyticus TaxID=1716077 RepID=A0A917SIB2_9ACTN|nr:NADP-dependent oxidoreductase [Microlunatus endophyticus]GGL83805.1 NADPH:quinone reductase [Microlunatus endophyticus]